MKFLSFDWSTFLRILPNWVDLDLELRRIYINNTDPSNVLLSTPELLENSDAFIAAGLLESASDGVRMKFTKESLPFRRAIQFMFNIPLLDLSDPQYFWQYLNSNFTQKEVGSFGGIFGRDCYSVQDIYDQVSSVSYIEEFLADSDPDKWERYRLTYDENPYIKNKKYMTGLLSMIRLIIKRGEPVYIHELSELVEGKYRSLLPDLLLAGIRHLLFFAAVDHQTLLPELGVLPKLLSRLNREEVDEPANVTVQETLFMPVLLDDMTILLQECAAGPIKMRKSDFGLFKKSEDLLFSRFYTMPNNLQEVLNFSPFWRLYQALNFSLDKKFVKQGKITSKNYGLTLIAKGKQWLQLSVEEQLRHLVDSCKTALNSPEYINYNQYELMEFGVYELRNLNIYQEIKRIFTNKLYHSFVLYPHFLDYHSRTSNPFVSYIDQQKAQRSHSKLHNLTRERAEEIWLEKIDHWIVEILFPIGCVEFGIDDDLIVAFRLTDVGRYFFELEDDFEYSRSSANQVTVLPNFEIVFMKPSPHAELMLNPFCERIGDTTGSLFRITSESVKQAAALGWSGERILAILKEASKNEIPANVEHEILDWSSQIKMVHLENVLLIHCPDEETAALIQSEAKNDVTALNPTTLSMHSRKKKDNLINAIRKKGVFLQSD